MPRFPARADAGPRARPVDPVAGAFSLRLGSGAVQPHDAQEAELPLLRNAVGGESVLVSDRGKPGRALQLAADARSAQRSPHVWRPLGAIWAQRVEAGVERSR